MGSLASYVDPASLDFDHYGYLVPIKKIKIRSKYSKQMYGPWEEEYSVELTSSTIKKIDKIPDIDECYEVVSELDLPAGSSAWIVWVVWSSGDSFGWAENSHVEVLAIFDHEWYATAFADYVRSEDYQSASPFERDEKENPFYFQSQDGQEFKFGYIPWDGYFESLESVHVDKILVQ